MAQKSFPKGDGWFECEKCQIIILQKDLEKHANACPQPDNQITSFSYISNQVLHGILDIKSYSEGNKLATRIKDGLVYVSQPVMQLCSFPIGEHVILESYTNMDLVPVVLKTWPTIEKSVTSVLVTQNCHDLINFPLGQFVSVKKLPEQYTEMLASQISLVLLKGTKLLELNTELCNRLTRSFEECYFTQGNFLSIMYYGSILKFEIKIIDSQADIESKFNELTIAKNTRKFYLVTKKTKWKIYKSNESFNEANIAHAAQTDYNQIAGLDNEIKEIQSMIEIALGKKQLNTFTQNKSILVHGNAGTGKTTLCKMLAGQFPVNVMEIIPSNLYSKNASTPEELLQELFEQAVKNAPSILILDEIDLLCPNRNGGKLTETEKRITCTILNSIDSVISNKKLKIFILATTNKLENIDPALRRCGRLDKEIEISSPTSQSRLMILKILLKTASHSLTEIECEQIARKTHGYVGADLRSLCSEASLLSIRNNRTKIIFDDFINAMKKVQPSAMRDVHVEVPDVKWSDIGGQENLKLILKQAVEWPLKYPESFLRLGVTPPKGVLMYGPPGCSKTMIAKALATESGLNFLSIKGPELFSKWVGESERAIREVFRKARQVAPSIVFFDEIDALGSERSSGSSTNVQERVLAQLLTELDGVTPLGDVTILAATNRPDRIDKALLRPGRLDRIVYVPLPDEKTREEIIRIKLSKMANKNIDQKYLIEATDGYSGAEITAVCHEAAMAALEENLQCEFVELRHFYKAFERISPRTPESLINLYKEYANCSNLCE